MSRVGSGNYDDVFLYHNGLRMSETKYGTFSDSGYVWSTGGRVVYIQAQAGDTISLRTGVEDFDIYYIITCFEYNAV